MPYRLPDASTLVTVEGQVEFQSDLGSFRLPWTWHRSGAVSLGAAERPLLVVSVAVRVPFAVSESSVEIFSAFSPPPMMLGNRGP
jgi:hypothetical protein